MATNLKGQGGIKGILLLHGEKIAIGVVGAIALLFVYKSVYVPRLDDKLQAPKLQSEVSQASTQLKEFSWTKAVAEFPDKTKKAEPIAAKNDLTVKVEDYQTSPNAFGPAVVAPMIVRTDPVLLNAMAVRATGGSGLLAFSDEKIKHEQEVRKAAELAEQSKRAEDKRKKDELEKKKPGGPRRGGRSPERPGRDISKELMDPAHPKRRAIEGSARAIGIPQLGGERIERAYWACVVAKVPIRQQLNLYDDAFKNARGYDPVKDLPRYAGYRIERSEVVPGKPLDWKPVPLYDGQHQSIAASKPIAPAVSRDFVKALMTAIQQSWAGVSPDVIDPRFADYDVLTLPLPPLAGRMWGSEATHPDIPLLSDTPALQEDAGQPAAAQKPAEAAATDENAGFSSTSATPTGPGPSSGIRRPSFAFGPEGGQPSSSGAFAGPGDKTIVSRGVDYLLLRFFDYTVEPGKQYKYRVKLALEDPNANFPSNALAPAVQDRLAKVAKNPATGQKYTHRFVDAWSEPSPTVGIPMGGNVRLADAKIPPAEKFNDEPSVTMLVESFDVDYKGNAIQAALDTGDIVHKKDFRRGCVANMIEDAEYLAEGGAFIDTQPGFKFLTGMTLLDIDGGAKLSKESKDMTAPVRVLVMGPSGQMYIRNESDDKPYVEYHRLLFGKSSDKHGAPGGPPGSEGPVRPRSMRPGPAASRK